MWQFQSVNSILLLVKSGFEVLSVFPLDAVKMNPIRKELKPTMQNMVNIGPNKEDINSQPFMNPRMITYTNISYSITQKLGLLETNKPSTPIP